MTFTRAGLFAAVISAAAGFHLPSPRAATVRPATRAFASSTVGMSAKVDVGTESADEAALLSLLASGDTGRGRNLSPADIAEVHRLAEALEAQHSADGAASEDTNDSPLLPGRWRVLYQGKPGPTTEFFSVDSWKRYISGDGPSPVQNLVAGSSTVSRLYQILALSSAMPSEDAAQRDDGRILNVVDASPAAVVAIDAQLEGRPQPNRLGFRFSGGRVLLRTLWNGTLALPYPVPFDLLGDNAKGA